MHKSSLLQVCGIKFKSSENQEQSLQYGSFTSFNCSCLVATVTSRAVITFYTTKMHVIYAGTDKDSFLCIWFRASLTYIDNCLTRCNTKQSIYYSASSLCTFRVSTTPIIKSTQNCNYRLRHSSYFLRSYLPPTLPRWREVAAQYRRLQLQFCVLLIMGVVYTRNVQSELAE